MTRILPLLLLLIALPALAQEPPQRVGVELNRLEARAEGCRFWLLLRNPRNESFDQLRLDLLLFGKDGVIARRLALDVAPLPAEKTMARIFDTAGLPCDGIGAVLLNDVLACGNAPSCLAVVATSSRVAGVSFDR